MAPDDKFDFTKYFQPIIDEFAIVGREVEIKKKDKKGFGKVESAFLKDNTEPLSVVRWRLKRKTKRVLVRWNPLS